MSDADGATRFIAIGENIHCSRVVKREGVRGGIAPDGRAGVRFPVTTISSIGISAYAFSAACSCDV